MLNISPNSIDEKLEKSAYRSFEMVKGSRQPKVLAIWLISLLGVTIIVMFLPWTQNIQAPGTVTTLRPEQRPQTIHSTIPGRIEQWYVREGDVVQKGDTILFLSEIKDKFFDPALLERTKIQLMAKQAAIKAYSSKVNALDNQIKALMTTRDLKLQQVRNKILQAGLKVQADSMNFIASQISNEIADSQLTRYQTLYDDDLISRTELEKRTKTAQEAQAKQTGSQNKFLATQNELTNARIEENRVGNEYAEKISKAESDRYSALSAQYDAEATVAKLENELTNLSIRAGFYYITAPQDGMVSKALKTGIGETIKEGTEIVSIVPRKQELAVEMFVEPMDLPLIHLGVKVRFQFDGWPTLFFSGWPNVSYGTFGGVIVAIDRNISVNGRYRILVAQDPEEAAWPEALRVGSGAFGMALLKDVPLYYEIWRRFNGFPPEYYVPDKNKQEKAKDMGGKKK